MNEPRNFHTAGCALIYLAECQLATVEELKFRKRVSKADIRRHESIAETAVHFVKYFATPQDLENSHHCIRVRKALSTPHPAASNREESST